MAKALITGIAGFIGSSIAKALLEQGAEVVGIDDMSSGRWENLASISSRIDFREASVVDAAEVAHACRKVDYIFHEAAIPSVPLSVADPVGTNDPNLCGTLNVFEAARHAGVKRVMYAASSAAYGNNASSPKSETMLPEPISPYAVQKIAGEHYASSYSHIFGLETVSLRYFNVFGPHQDPTSQYSGVLAIFISKMLAGQSPTIFGDGSTSRDFVFIDNVVQANLLAAKASAHVSGKVFNVATGSRTTLLEAFKLLKEIIQFEGDVAFKPERAGDVRHSLADISLIKSMMGYTPTVDFRCGLQHTVRWYKESMATMSL